MCRSLFTGSCRRRGYVKGEGEVALDLGALETMFRVGGTVAYTVVYQFQAGLRM